MAALCPVIQKNNSRAKDGDYKTTLGETIKSPSSGYEVLEFLGKGTFGQVVKCWKRDTGEVVAMKILKDIPSYAKQGQIEVEILQRLRGECANTHNFVRAYESFTHLGHICIVFELLHMNLYDYLKSTNFQPMPLKFIRPIIQQVLVCLMKLRELGLVHADLKPENIMFVDPQRLPFRVKVVDFGSATSVSASSHTSYLQSRYYRAPEVIMGLPFDYAIDMWSLGCVAAELYLGWPLFPGSSEYDQLRYITELLGFPSQDQLMRSTKVHKFMSLTDGGWRLKSVAEYFIEYGVRSKESRKYIFTALSDLTRIPLEASQDEVELSILQLDRQEFVSLLSGLLRLDTSQRLTPEQALHKPFITLHHLAVHAHTKSIQDVISWMQVCQHSKFVHIPETLPPCFMPVIQQATIPEPIPLVYSLAPSTVAYFPPPPVTMATDDRGYASAESSPTASQDMKMFFPGGSPQVVHCSYVMQDPMVLSSSHSIQQATASHVTNHLTTYMTNQAVNSSNLFQPLQSRETAILLPQQVLLQNLFHAGIYSSRL